MIDTNVLVLAALKGAAGEGTGTLGAVVK